MKSIIQTYTIVVVVLIVSTLGCKKSGSNAESGVTAQPVATRDVQEAQAVPMPVATPAGPATRATIGAVGGALKSADGRMEISVPPGVFSSDTQVSIQAMNVADLDGVGPVYQLSPEGLHFAQPVTLEWRLSDADLTGGALENVIIATRDANGGWKRQPGVDRDPASKTVRVTSTHFSQWKATWLQYLPDLNIVPVQTDVRVNASVTLKATRGTISSEPDDLTPPPPKSTEKGQSDADLLTPPAPSTSKGVSEDDPLTPPGYVWRVNGVQGGDKNSGFVHAGGSPDTVIYTAPAKVPSKNPVTVSCEETGKHAKIIATSMVNVTEKRGWHILVHYFYHEEHSQSGLTVAGEPGKAWGKVDRLADAEFNIYSDPRWAGGAAGGMGTGSLQIEQRGGTDNATCHAATYTTIRGDVKMEGGGNVGAGTGTLSVDIHGDDLESNTDAKGCGSLHNTQHFGGASFATSCKFTKLDYDKGGGFSGTPPVADNGNSKCNVTITPQ